MSNEGHSLAKTTIERTLFYCCVNFHPVCLFCGLISVFPSIRCDSEVCDKWNRNEKKMWSFFLPNWGAAAPTMNQKTHNKRMKNEIFFFAVRWYTYISHKYMYIYIYQNGCTEKYVNTSRFFLHSVFHCARKFTILYFHFIDFMYSIYFCLILGPRVCRIFFGKYSSFFLVFRIFLDFSLLTFSF